MLGVQVLDKNKRHPRVGRQIANEFLERFDTTGGRANRNYKKRLVGL